MTRPLPLFRVLREEARESRFAGSTAGSMVGRAAELAELQTAWSKAKAGSGQAVLLVGEPGIGKSRLLHALAGAIAEDNFVQQFIQCSIVRSESPFWPIAQRLALNADIATNDDSPTRAAKLTRTLAPGTAGSETP